MSSMSRGSLSTGQGSPRSSSPPGDEGQHSPSASSSLRHRAPSPSPTTKKAKQSVNDQLGLPSPRDFRHKQRRQSDGECMLMQQPESITNLHHVHSSIPLNIFECGNEVKELVAVGDKVWTADRRSAKVSIRCTKTGEIEKQLKPPTRDENDNKKQDKEHIFPWSIIHVRFLKSRSPFRFDNIDQTTSDDEEDVVAQRFNQSSSLLRDTPSPSPGGMGKTSFSSIPGGVLDPEYKSESRSTRKRAAPRRSSSSSRHPPPLKTVGSMTSLMSGRNHNVSNMNESSAMHTVPATGDKLTKDQYVDEVWVGYSNGCIRAFDATSGKYLFEMIEQGGIYCMTSWGDYVYSGSNDWTIRKWDAAKRVCVGQFLPGDQGHSNSVRALCIAEEYLVSASDDFTLRLWDHMSVGQDAYNTTGRCLRVLHGHKASVLTLAYCDGRLWSGSEDATVMVWDLKGDKPQLLRQLSDTRHVVTKLVPLPDIHRVLCCSVDNVLRVYNTKKLELEQELDGHTGFIHSCAAVATVLRYVVWSSSQDGTLRFWSIAGDDKPQSCSKFVTDSDPSNELGRVRFRLNESEAREALLAKSLQDLQDRNNRLQGDHDRSASRLAALEAENEKKDEDIAHLKHLLEQERQKAGQSLSSNKEAVSDLQRELDKRQQEAERLQRLLDKMEKDTARTEEEKQRKYDDVVDGLKKQLDQLRQDLQDARDDQSGGRRKQNDLENERKRLLAENRDRDGVERSLRKELEDALQQLENEKDQRRHLESKMRGRMEENKGMAKLGEEARDALKHERDLLAEELSRVQGDDLQSREALQRKSAIAAFHEANAFMLHNRAHAAEKRCMQLENMQSRVIDANAQIKTANAELYKLRKSNETLMDENEAWQRTVEGLKNDLRDALQRLRTTQNELEDLKEENGLLLKDKEGGKKRVTMAEDDAKNARNRLRDEVADLESRLHKLTDENERLDQKLRRLGTLEADHVTQAEENQILRDQIQDLLTQLHKLRGCEKEGKEALSELESLKDELERVMAERDNLRNRGEEVKSLRAELANQKGRVNRTEEVLNHLRSQKNDLDELVKKLREDLETARNELDERDSSDRNLRLQMELNKMQGDANNHYQFIMQSRTDFIQAVYDWLLCSAMARRHMKRFDLNSQESLETLQQAVEGAYKRGHYILSNYVSELEKHHLGVSPTLYPPDPILQAMFISQRKECASFLKGDSRYNPAAITRVGILVDDNEVLRRLQLDDTHKSMGGESRGAVQGNDAGDDPQDLSQRAASASYTSPTIKGDSPHRSFTQAQATPRKVSPSPLNSTRNTIISPLNSTRGTASPLGSTRNTVGTPISPRTRSSSNRTRSFTPPAAYRRANSQDGSRKGHQRPQSPSTVRRKSPQRGTTSSNYHPAPEKRRKDKEPAMDAERPHPVVRAVPSSAPVLEPVGGLARDSTSSSLASPGLASTSSYPLASPPSPVLPTETPNLSSVTFRRNKLMSVIREKSPPTYKRDRG